MAIVSTEKLQSQPLQFRGVFNHVIEYEAVWNPDNVLSNGEFHESITVEGATPGDFVLISSSVDTQDMDLNGQVTAADTVRVGLHNLTGGAIDIGETHLHIVLLRPVHTVG